MAGQRRHGRAKFQRSRVDGVASERRPAQPCRGPHGRQVLRPQAGLIAIGADVSEAERPPGQCRQAKAGAQDLSAALTHAAVDSYHGWNRHGIVIIVGRNRVCLATIPIVFEFENTDLNKKAPLISEARFLWVRIYTKRLG